MRAFRRLAPIVFLLGCRSTLPAPELRNASPEGPAAEPRPPTIGPISLPDDRDGSRLKTRRWSPEDGAAVAGNGIRDTLLDANS